MLQILPDTFDEDHLLVVVDPSGAKAPSLIEPAMARLKPCPTKT